MSYAGNKLANQVDRLDRASASGRLDLILSRIKPMIGKWVFAASLRHLAFDNVENNHSD